MKRHIAGKTVRGAVALELPVPDVRVIREAAHVSQSQFAKPNWREPAHFEKLGITPHPPNRARAGASQNGGVQTPKP